MHPAMSMENITRKGEAQVEAANLIVEKLHEIMTKA
jgi:hypothetical protein